MTRNVPVPGNVPHRSQERLQDGNEERSHLLHRERKRGTTQWQCATCHQTLNSWAASERHADTQHHHRITLVLVEK